MIETASGATEDEFSVYQYFPNGRYEEVHRYVDAKTAVLCAKALTESVGGHLGTTCRVIITDGEDFITFDWVYGKGVVFPTREQCEAGRR